MERPGGGADTWPLSLAVHALWQGAPHHSTPRVAAYGMKTIFVPVCGNNRAAAPSKKKEAKLQNCDTNVWDPNPPLHPLDSAPSPSGQSPPAALQYLVKWKDGSDSTWEPVGNLSKDLLRDFEERWWQICRGGDAKAMAKMLETGRVVLSNTLDKERRCGLHFTAAVGSVQCTRLLINAGAEVRGVWIAV